MSKGRTIEQFSDAHDRSVMIPKKIREGLKQLGDSWEYEAEFLKRCKLPLNGISAYRDQFKDHVVEVAADRKRIWAGTVKFATKLRERVQ